MIITCPSCATRYDVEEDRFLPDGRSVRCADCDESWFVPAPDPIEDLIPLNRGDKAEDRSHDDELRADRGADRDVSRDHAADHRAHDTDFGGHDRGRDDDPDDALFEDRSKHGAHRNGGNEERTPGTKFRIVEEDADDKRRAKPDDDLPPRDEKGRFIKVENKDTSKGSASDLENCEDDAIDRGYDDREDEDLFARAPSHSSGPRTRGRHDPRDYDRRDYEEDYRDADYREAGYRGRPRRDEAYRDDYDDRHYDARPSKGHRGHREDAYDGGDDWRPDRRSRLKGQDREREEGIRTGRDARVVDVDFEDIDHDDEYVMEKGFGRKVREERRRSTALAKVEDLDPLAERLFNDEFFAALRVQPKELERAIRKARRRAEARDKNRLTPLSVLGWSALVGVIAASGFVGYTYRDQIVAAFPKTATAYEAVGIEANPFGLKIEDINHRIAMSTSGPTIEITGRLSNQSEASVAPPLLQAEALGPRGELLSRWTFAAEAEQVAEGASVDFVTRAPAPEGVSEVILSFAPTEGVRVSVTDLIKPVSN